MNIHNNITQKLNMLLEQSKVPNIIFHGPSGSGKRTIVKDFIAKVYNHDKQVINDCTMYVNCAHGKGIKFIRDDVKFFAKSNINKTVFKTITLSNADKMTVDAQSALRRCIELFSHTTRFFIIVENKYKLLKPILSRFCEIFIPEPKIKNDTINLHIYNKQHNNALQNLNKLSNNWLIQTLKKKITNTKQVVDLVEKLYEKGYSGLDLIDFIEESPISIINKYQKLIMFRKIKKEFRNEKIFMTFILNFLFLRSDYNLENVSFM